MPSSVLILNGPNLNMLGMREPEIYGHTTLEDIEIMCREHAANLGIHPEFFQSNVEGELVTRLQQAVKDNVAGIIINAAAYTHTSIALLDALMLQKAPVIEVHLTNIYQRETYRHTSYISRAATGLVCGLGPQGYLVALDALYKLNAN